MVETSGVSEGVSDNGRTTACFREHLHCCVTAVCDVREGSRRLCADVVVINAMRPFFSTCCHRAAPIHSIASEESCCKVACWQ